MGNHRLQEGRASGISIRACVAALYINSLEHCFGSRRFEILTLMRKTRVGSLTCAQHTDSIELRMCLVCTTVFKTSLRWQTQVRTDASNVLDRPEGDNHADPGDWGCSMRIMMKVS